MNMKKIKFAALILAGAALLGGCATEQDKMDEHHFGNKVYLNISDAAEEIIVKATSTDISRSLTIGTPLQVENEVSATLVADESLISEYESTYGEDVEMLPDSLYTLEGTDMVIEAGSNKSAAATVSFTNLTALDRNLVYVLPVALTNVKGEDVLESKTKAYYVFRAGALVNVVCGLKENRAYPDWKNAEPVTNMSQFTLETLVYCNAFGKTISTIMGIEGNFLIRIGDAGVPDNQIQIATSYGNLTSSDLQLETLKWYHVAVTFDSGSIVVYINGKEKLSGYKSLNSVNIGVAHTNEDDGSRCFWVGYSYSRDRYLDGYVAETRIWNKVLTAEDLNSNSHFYTVDPESEGLVAYWKFDEGAGTTIKDYSQYGNDLTVDSEPQWKSVSLPE